MIKMGFYYYDDCLQVEEEEEAATWAREHNEYEREREHNGQLSCAVHDPKQVKRRKLQLHNSEEPNA